MLDLFKHILKANSINKNSVSLTITMLLQLKAANKIQKDERIIDAHIDFNNF